MGKIIYCITTNDGPLNLELKGSTLESITEGSLVAVVSETDETRLRVSRSNTLQHQKVIEHIMSQRSAVLPMRFSTIATSEEVISKHILGTQSKTLVDRLEQFRDTCEYGLRVLWPREALFAKVLTLDPELELLRAQVQNVSAQIMLGQRIEKGIKTVHEDTAAKVMALLQGNYQEYRANEVKDDTVSLNGSFLIKNKDVKALELAVEACDARFDGLLTFKFVGPLPAYSFIELTIALDDKKETTPDGTTEHTNAATNGTD